jgi:hypothetical protein
MFLLAMTSDDKRTKSERGPDGQEALDVAKSGHHINEITCNVIHIVSTYVEKTTRKQHGAGKHAS